METTKEMQSLEEEVKFNIERNKENPGKCLVNPDLIYRLQSKIIHESEQEERGIAINLFNSLPEEYRKFAFQNYEGNELNVNKENFTLSLK